MSTRHSRQSPDFQDFAPLLTENASDFQDPQGINHSLAALYKLLASGQISPRRATGLAYIASLLLRTIPAMRDGMEPTHVEIDVPPRDHFSSVPARGCVGLSPDEYPRTLSAAQNLPASSAGIIIPSLATPINARGHK